MKRLFIALCLVLSVASVARAEAPAELITSAFANMGPPTPKGWSFSKTTTTSAPQRVQVERFDPATAGDGWALVSINGAAPSQGELAAYRRAKRPALTGQDNNQMRATIRDETLELVSEDERRVTYRFKARATDPRDPFTGHLSGEITVSKSGVYVERFRLFSTGPFSAVGVKAELFDNTARFSKLGDGRTVFLTETRTIMRGRWAGVVKVDTSATTRFTDYRAPKGR